MQRGGHNVLQMIEFSQSTSFVRPEALESMEFSYFVSFLKLRVEAVIFRSFGEKLLNT